MTQIVEHVARALKDAEDEAPQGGFGSHEAWMPAARAAVETMLPAILQIIHDQPFYPDTHTGMRQQWVKDQIAEKVAALGEAR